MNEQLQNKLAEILGQIASGVKAAGDFTMTQLPDIAQQYVSYGRFSSTLFLIIFVLITSALIYLIYWALKKSPRDRDGDVHDYAVGITIFGSLGVIMFGIFTLIHLNYTLMVWFAPKVWLIKELAGLMK